MAELRAEGIYNSRGKPIYSEVHRLFNCDESPNPKASGTSTKRGKGGGVFAKAGVSKKRAVQPRSENSTIMCTARYHDKKMKTALKPGPTQV